MTGKSWLRTGGRWRLKPRVPGRAAQALTASEGTSRKPPANSQNR
jgi:hypothetical protein